MMLSKPPKCKAKPIPPPKTKRIKKEFDEAKMKAYGYSLAIVCSSSVNGDNFEGAVGSTLWIDKFTIEREKTE